MTFLLLQLPSTFLLVSLAFLTLICFARLRVLTKAGQPVGSEFEDLPFVSILVPARNEEKNIERCIQSLVDQDYPNYEIIVIDDCSTDATGQIIAAMAEKYHKIKHLNGQEPPPNWTGKCYALSLAAQQASGGWFVFTDADTQHTSVSLRTAITYAETEGLDLISLVPVQELGSFWERLVMPTLLGTFLVGDPALTVSDPEKDRAYAYGPYIAIRRQAYRSIGGHACVHDQILEDVGIARVVKKAGFRISMASGLGLYRVRMYTGLRTLWEGWTKNAYEIIGPNLAFLLLNLLALNVALLAPYIVLAFMGFMWLGGSTATVSPAALALSCVEIGATYLWFYKISQYYAGRKFYDFFLLPIGSIAVTAIYITSAYLFLTKRKVAWRGRTYAVNSARSEVELPSG